MGAADSKLAFRKGVFRLFEERHIPSSADDYWSLFWTLPETVDDVFSLISPSDIRRARDSARENVETLLNKVLEHMRTVVGTHTASSPQYPPEHLLNCCRVLTRLLPFLFESPDCQPWLHEYFWKPFSQPGSNPDTHRSEGRPSSTRGEALLKLTLQSLFLAGFTLPASMATSGIRVNYVIWETGVGSTVPIGVSRDNEVRRIEVLGLLTVLLSHAMYCPPGKVLSAEDPWLNCLVKKTERRVVLALLCSLLNTACKYNPLGWGVPYNHVVFTDVREQLVTLCLHVLLVTLDYTSPHELDMVRDFGSADLHPDTMDASQLHEGSSRSAYANSTHRLEDNAFRYYVSKIYRAQDFQFIIDGMDRILSNPMQADKAYLPRSTRRVRCHVEMMALLWKLLYINPRLRGYLVDAGRALDLTVVLIYYAIENKTKPAQIGLVRLCAVILQTLSTAPAFGAKLNRVFDAHAALPASMRIPAFQGTYADFLVISLFQLIATSHGTLSTLYPTLILIINNVSPYLKHLSPASSGKLVALFSSISAPGFLLADEANHQLVEYMLDVFNHVLQHHYADNLHLVYCIVHHHAKFRRLHTLSLPAALADLEIAQTKKEDSQRPTILDRALTEAPAEEKEDTVPVEANDGVEVLERQSSVSSTVSVTSLLPGARHGFTPTETWLQQWLPRLPLQPILDMLDELVPQVEAYCHKTSPTEDQVCTFLRSLSLPDHLPRRPIMAKPVQWGDHLMVWFRSLIWGQAYVSSLAVRGPWQGTHIRLFQIQTPPSPAAPSPQTTAASASAALTSSLPSSSSSRRPSTSPTSG